MVSLVDIAYGDPGNWQVNVGMGMFSPQIRQKSQEGSQRELYNQLFKTERKSLWPELADRIRELEHLYIFSNVNEIREFINKHNYIIDILFEGQMRINEIFGNDIEKYLEITIDPEENYKELFIVIRSNYNSKKARKLMDRLDNEWFISRIKQTKGKLCITEEPL